MEMKIFDESATGPWATSPGLWDNCLRESDLRSMSGRPESGFNKQFLAAGGT